MLIEFRAENHRSIREEKALSMEARREDGADVRPRDIAGCADPLLPVIGLYGANASGKSNILSALAFMRDAITDSHRNWSIDEGIPREPFAWGQCRTMPSLFEVVIVVEGVKYQYGFTASDSEFLEEWLFAWPNNHKQTWFERDKLHFNFGQHFGAGSGNRLIEEVTRPNALFLSAAVQHKHAQVLPVHSWFRDLHTLNLNVPRPLRFYSGGDYSLRRLFEDEGQQLLLDGSMSMRERFRTMLRNADVGIVDVKMLKEETDRRTPYARFILKHEGSDDGWLPLDEESRGTRTLFRMALPILQALEWGRTLLVDELEASLHPALAQKIVAQFNNPETNPHNAQLIFTTHDTNLLGTTLGDPVLRRDQVWLTEKSDEGATDLYPLTDFKPRKNENLERGYLQGRYGAIPFLGNFLRDNSNAEGPSDET